MVKQLVLAKYLDEKLEINDNFGGVTAYLCPGRRSEALRAGQARFCVPFALATAKPALDTGPAPSPDALVILGVDQALAPHVEALIALTAELRAVRVTLAREHELRLHNVFTDKQAAETAAKLPFSIRQYREVTGIGHKKAKDFGALILTAVSDFVRRHPELQQLADERRAAAAAEPKEPAAVLDLSSGGAPPAARAPKRGRVEAAAEEAENDDDADFASGGKAHGRPPPPRPATAVGVGAERSRYFDSPAVAAPAATPPSDAHLFGEGGGPRERSDPSVGLAFDDELPDDVLMGLPMGGEEPQPAPRGPAAAQHAPPHPTAAPSQWQQPAQQQPGAPMPHYGAPPPQQPPPRPLQPHGAQQHYDAHAQIASLQAQLQQLQQAQAQQLQVPPQPLPVGNALGEGPPSFAAAAPGTTVVAPAGGGGGFVTAASAARKTSKLSMSKR